MIGAYDSVRFLDELQCEIDRLEVELGSDDLRIVNLKRLRKELIKMGGIRVSKQYSYLVEVGGST